MRVNDAARSVELCREAGVPLFLWGHTGIGKSTIIKTICQKYGWGFIDFRLPQIEASDLRGLPDRENGKTTFFPPSCLPTEGNGILFLDELPRAQEDVLQATFQLLLDRRIGDYTLPDGWSVVSAGNPMTNYISSNFTDTAFLDRFCHVIINVNERYLSDWGKWLSTAHEGKTSERILSFVGSNIEHLGFKDTVDLGFAITPSPRSWELAARLLKVCNEHQVEKNLTGELLGGLIGTDLSIAFLDWSCDIYPTEVINDGVKTIESRLGMLDDKGLTGLSFGVSSFSHAGFNEKQAINVLDYCVHLIARGNKDLAVGLLVRCLPDNLDKEIGAACISNAKSLAAIVGGKTNVSKIIEKCGVLMTLHRYPEIAALISKAAWGK